MDVIGISSLATDHLLVPKLMAAMRTRRSTTSPSSSAASCRHATRSAARLRRRPRVPSGRVARRYRRDLSASCASAAPPQRLHHEQTARPPADAARVRRCRAPLARGVCRQHAGTAKEIVNRSGIADQAAVHACRLARASFRANAGFPGQFRSPAASIRRCIAAAPGRSGSSSASACPRTTTRALKAILANGATAVSLIPCNSVYRGYDTDEVHAELLGTCGIVINTRRHGPRPRRRRPRPHVVRDERSVALHPARFMLAAARRRGVAWRASPARRTRATACRTSSPTTCSSASRCRARGASWSITSHSATRTCRGWNPLSVVGQHMQQAGATPAEAMAFTLCSAIQYADDCVARGMDPDAFLPRFTFFFDISISFFEEIAKFRAGRRIWARRARALRRRRMRAPGASSSTGRRRAST